MQMNAPDLPPASWDEQGCQAVKQVPFSISSACAAAMHSECTGPSALGLPCAAPRPSHRQSLEVPAIQRAHLHVNKYNQAPPGRAGQIIPRTLPGLSIGIPGGIEPCSALAMLRRSQVVGRYLSNAWITPNAWNTMTRGCISNDHQAAKKNRSNQHPIVSACSALRAAVTVPLATILAWQ